MEIRAFPSCGKEIDFKPGCRLETGKMNLGAGRDNAGVCRSISVSASFKESWTASSFSMTSPDPGDLADFGPQCLHGKQLRICDDQFLDEALIKLVMDPPQAKSGPGSAFEYKERAKGGHLDMLLMLA